MLFCSKGFYRHFSFCKLLFFLLLPRILDQQHSCCIISETLCEFTICLLPHLLFGCCTITIKSGNSHEATCSTSLLTHFGHLHLYPLPPITLPTPTHTAHIPPLVLKCFISRLPIATLQSGVGERRTFPVYSGN